MKKCTVLTTLILLTFLISTPIHAKWWIFGQGNDEVSIKYLYVNDFSYDEGTEEITLYRSFLSDGNITIRGKASVKKGSIGSVQISLDKKATWNKARLSKDGAFEYIFKPEAGKSYEMYVKILDTSGKTNDVDETRRVIKISEEDIRAAILEVLNQLTETYMAENASKFMEYVSENFDGDDLVLDNAIRKDFSIFDNIDLRFRLYNVASGPKGRVYASISYNRFVVGTRDGASYKDKGITEFSFIPEGKGLKVKSMKHPIIFGVSDAANVGTGVVVAGLDEDILTVDPRGQISLKPVSEAVNEDDDETGGVASGIPTPQNLRIVEGTKHHRILLDFDWDWDMQDLADYELIVEEAHSSDGPWSEELRIPGDDTYIHLTTDAIAQEATILFYRIKLTRSGAVGAPSNVVAWDNN